MWRVSVQVPVISWFDDMSDRTLLDLIPFFENLAAADDIYSFLADNLTPVPTVYIGAVTTMVVPASSIPMSPSPVQVPAVSSGSTAGSTFVTVSNCDSVNGSAS